MRRQAKAGQLRGAALFLALAGWLALPAAAQSSKSPLAAQASKPQVKPTDLDAKLLQTAIARAVAALYKMEPDYTFPPAYAFHTYNYEARHAMGNQALAVWALLAAGESYQNPPLYRRLNLVLSGDAPYTYDRGMRATMLNELPRARWAPWINRDGLWLSNALTDEGNFTDEWTGTQAKGSGDNANGQYGVLGLWNIDRAGYPIKAQVWERIDRYWRKAQQKTSGDQAAGWGVFSFDKPATGKQLNFYSRVSGPMTAGGVATLSLTERFLRGASMLDPKKENVSPELRRGIRWLDENFSLDDKAEESDWFFYMWTIQRVGGATGYRTFNGVDWFRAVTARILNQQQADGSFAGDKGRLLSTGFAVLYLAKANDPLAVSKIRFKAGEKDGSWNNHPHDLWNFVDYASDEYECATTWQIAELTQPTYELLESPMLYLGSDQAVALSPLEIDNLRSYIDAGGLLILNAEDNKGEALRSFRELAAKLYPGKEFKRAPKEHPFYDLHQPVRAGLEMQVIDNGLRPLIVFFPKDVGRDLQSNDRVGADGFRALSNIYLYVTGMNPRRARLESNFVPLKNDKPKRTLAAARIKYAGRYDPEPAALQQLKTLLANKGDIQLQISELEPQQLSERQKLAFLTTTGEGQLTDAQAAALRAWLEAGGTLWLDAAGGSESARHASIDMLSKIVPGKIPAPLPQDDPIISGKDLIQGANNRRVQYRLFTLSKMLPTSTPRLQSVELNDRKAIIYASEDITCGLAGLDHWNIYGYTSEFARRLVLNGVLTLMPPPPPPAPPKPPATAPATTAPATTTAPAPTTAPTTAPAAAPTTTPATMPAASR